MTDEKNGATTLWGGSDKADYCLYTSSRNGVFVVIVVVAFAPFSIPVPFSVRTILTLDAVDIRGHIDFDLLQVHTLQGQLVCRQGGRRQRQLD